MENFRKLDVKYENQSKSDGFSFGNWMLNTKINQNLMDFRLFSQLQWDRNATHVVAHCLYTLV